MARLKVLFFTGALIVGMAQAVPPISNDPNNIQPGQWTSRITQAKTKAAQLGLPMLVACLDHVTCSYCKTWDANVISSLVWRDFVRDYPMILVMLDRSKLSASEWSTLPAPYRVNGSMDFPTVAIHAPNGSKLTQFLARQNYATATGFKNQVLRYTESYYNVAPPPVPGQVSFTAATGEIVEGQVYTGSITRTGGSSGAATITLASSPGHTIQPASLTWADGDASSKSFVISDIAATPAFDNRTITVTLTRTAGDVSLGLANQTITVVDQLVAADPLYKTLAVESGVWSYDEEESGLFLQDFDGNNQAALVLTAPAAGMLYFNCGTDNEDSNTSFNLNVAGVPHLLSADFTNLSVAVSSGEQIRWLAEGSETAPDFTVFLTELSWEPLTGVGGAALNPPTESKLQIDNVYDDHSLVELRWSSAASNPEGTTQQLYFGNTAETLLQVADDVASGIDAVAAGLVNPNEAQGWLYWRVDTLVAGDFGLAVAPGPVWRFATVNLPVFTGVSPLPGSLLNAYLKTGAQITLGAESASPITYSASGLPTGLTIDPRTGTISGKASKAGSSPVVVRATTAEGFSELSFTIRTQSLPTYALNTTLNGALFERLVPGGLTFASNLTTPVNGTLSFKVSKSGKITAKLVAQDKKYAFKGDWDIGGPDGTFAARLLTRAGDVLDVSLAPNGLLRGNFNGQALLAATVDKVAATAFVGSYTTAFWNETLEVGSPAINNRPEGYGYAALTLNAKGSVKFAGVLADGAKLSGSTPIMVMSAAQLSSLGFAATAPKRFALFPVYAPLYGKRGSLGALMLIESLGSPSGNRVWLDNGVWTYPGKSRTLTGDGFVAVLQGLSNLGAPSESAGGVGSFFIKRQDLQSAYNRAYLSVAEEPPQPIVANRNSLALARNNALGGKLKASSANGIFSGNAKLTGAGNQSAGKAKFTGALITWMGQAQGLGSIQVLDNSTGSYKLKRSLPVTILPLESLPQ